MSSTHAIEVASGKRFRFGENWSRFLVVLDDGRIQQAEASLLRMLGTDSLQDKSFVDVGSGSGLFSLAARRLGARVHSFDYDPDSVACTRELRRRYFEEDPQWKVEEASILDPAYAAGLGRFDIVYSWGVLHHTGSMWQAIGNATGLVAPGGTVFISIYNDQGAWSRRWLLLKKIYNKLPSSLQLPYAFVTMGSRELKAFAGACLKLRLRAHIDRIRAYSVATSTRGMSYWHDLRDWIGGYPFEVAKPEEVFYFFRQRGFELRRLKTCAGGIGCNEFVFQAPLQGRQDRCAEP
jgi:2-polyprenyl-6-hydroxyphenyl methylase/3-demethylubiquinone-9 3-methyltransferase